MSALKPAKTEDYKIADLSLAPWGRKELTIAARRYVLGVRTDQDEQADRPRFLDLRLQGKEQQAVFQRAVRDPSFNGPQ